MNNDGNGELDLMAQATDEAFAGALYKVGERQRDDGVVTKLDPQQLGVLQRAMTAVKSVQDYRQELKTANWVDLQLASKAVAAIHERLMCGVDIAPVIDRIIAESAGVNSSRLTAIIAAINNTFFHTNYMAQNKKGWFNRNKGGNATGGGDSLLTH